MKKISILFVSVFLLGLAFQSCNNQKTYAEMKKEEKEAIRRFIEKEGIEVLSIDRFAEQDSTTDVSKNQYVLFAETGVYMQIVEEGKGEKLEDGRHEVLARYLEKRIGEGGESDTLSANNQGYPYPDEMMLTKNGKNYSATFTTGQMYQTYGTTAVPSGWLVPFDYIKVGREIPARAVVKLIVPHEQGHIDASRYVYPCYYEITYQLAR